MCLVVGSLGGKARRGGRWLFHERVLLMDFPFSYNSTPTLRSFSCKESRFVIIKKITMSIYNNNLKRSSGAPITAIITPAFDLYD